MHNDVLMPRMNSLNFLYSSEASLVSSFCSLLDSEASPWGPLLYSREFNYIRGKTDLVALNSRNEILAFEFKLNKWREALQQAYRNTCFAHLSYMVLPKKSAVTALTYYADLDIRSVGLCSILENKIEILVCAKPSVPIQPWLSVRAKEKAKGDPQYANPGA